MEHLRNFISNDRFLTCTETVLNLEKALKNKRVILLYFARSDCPNCKKFLPQLKELYEKSKEMHLRWEIIYISFDDDEKIMMKNFSTRHGGWLAIPFGDPSIWILKCVYDITHIPAIIVLGADGSIISRTGMADYRKYGINVLVAWDTMPPR